MRGLGGGGGGGGGEEQRSGRYGRGVGKGRCVEVAMENRTPVQTTYRHRPT